MLIKKLKKANYMIVIATGRSYPSIKNQANIYNILYDYLICADGSIIYNSDDTIEKMYPMKKDIINPLECFYQNLDYEEIQFSYPCGYSNIINNTDDLLGINICISTSKYTLKLVNSFMKMSKDYPNYNFLNYEHPNFSYLCVKPKNISKSYAIKYLVKKHNILKEDVYVIGDSPNDYEMIHDFNGVCVKESYKEILEIAKRKYQSIDNYIDEILKED